MGLRPLTSDHVPNPSDLELVLNAMSRLIDSEAGNMVYV